MRIVNNMSDDQGDKQPKYYIKLLDRTAGGKSGAPNWCIYKRLEHGSIAVCLCYDEPTARELLRLLIADDGNTQIF
jgi:hypothetical protein